MIDLDLIAYRLTELLLDSLESLDNSSFIRHIKRACSRQASKRLDRLDDIVARLLLPGVDHHLEARAISQGCPWGSRCGGEVSGVLA